MTNPMPLDEARQRMPPIWVIYANPTDAPGEYVVRRWYGLTPDPASERVLSLEQARRLCLSQGASVRMLPSDRDEAVIAETWI